MDRRNCRMAGMGAYLPERIVRNSELAQLLGKSEEWIHRQFGVRERRYATEGEGSAFMGAKAAHKALADASLNPRDIEFVIFATFTSDYFYPGAGCYLQALLGLEEVGVLDVRNQGSGFLYALSVANALIAAGQYERILVVGSEAPSRLLGQPGASPELASLLGDAAAAVLLEHTQEEGLLGTRLFADGREADYHSFKPFDLRHRPSETTGDLWARDKFPVMDRKRVFVRAVEGMARACSSVLDSCGMTPEQLDLFIPHQAGFSICDGLRQRLQLPPENVFHNYQTRGDTSAASLPLALVEAREAGLLHRGDLVLMSAFGSGFTWGSALLRY
jgi:3-oxoacyl-[acyl-carrier-protein] synthase-3